MASDISGIDDFIAQLALTRRARLRHMADGTLCGRQMTHPRRPSDHAQNRCTCIRPAGHDHGCLCEHDIERIVPSHR